LSCGSGGVSGGGSADESGAGNSSLPSVPQPPPPPTPTPLPQQPPIGVEKEDHKDDGAGVEMDAAIAAAVAASRVPVNAAAAVVKPTSIGRSRKRKAAASPAHLRPTEYKYTSVSAHARGFYEDLRDNKRSEPLVRLRKAARIGAFNSTKLRELQRFVLGATRGGLPVAAQEQLYNLINTIEADAVTGASAPVKKTFTTFNSFKQAIVDDLDAAVLAEGWRKVTITEDGETLNAYFRPVLDVVMALLDGQAVVG